MALTQTLINAVEDSDFFKPFLGLIYGCEKIVQGWPMKLFVLSVLMTPVYIFGYEVVEDMAPIIALGSMLAVDFFTGALNAWIKDEFSSKGLRLGGGKIMAYILLILMANQAVVATQLLFWLPVAVYFYIGLTEFVSIVENLRAMGMKIPGLKTLFSLSTSEGRKKFQDNLIKDTKVLRKSKDIDEQE